MNKKNTQLDAKAEAPAMEATATMPTSATVASAPMIAGEVEAWGAAEEIQAGDILVPKIYHMQAMSKLVAEDKARPGDWVDSVTGEVLCKKDGTLEVLIFGLFKTMIIERFDFASQKYQLDKVIRLTPQTALEYASKPFIEEVGEERFKNSLYYNFYCLLPSAITSFPYVLSFGSTKTKAAKRLGLMLKKLEQNKKPSAAYVFEFKSIAEKNEKGSWFGIEIAQGRESTPGELQVAKGWYLKSKAHNISAVETGTEDEDSMDDVPF